MSGQESVLAQDRLSQANNADVGLTLNMSDSVSFKAQGRYQQIGGLGGGGTESMGGNVGLKISFRMGSGNAGGTLSGEGFPPAPPSEGFGGADSLKSPARCRARGLVFVFRTAPVRRADASALDAQAGQDEAVQDVECRDEHGQGQQGLHAGSLSFECSGNIRLEAS
jgi:hypothetical protein